MERAECGSGRTFLTTDMIVHEPFLFLSRLLITYRGQPVYDEKFHDGVNIIRGRNSTGKSTITDFIFFSLGGDFASWKPEAERCENVLAEVEANGANLTLRRRVEGLRMQGMEIFWGPMEEALEAPITGWQLFPFRRTETKDSFSQVLFRALGFPEVRGEQESNITMHQILRLICVDQLSSVLSLFRDEQFDSPLTRRTVGDLLYGVHDNQLYQDELRLRNARRELEEAGVEHKSLKSVLEQAGQMVDPNTINSATEEVVNQLAEVRKALRGASERSEVEGASEQGADLRAAELELRSLRIEYAAISEQEASMEMEAEDSREFIANLGKRFAALEESSAVEEAFGKLTLRICPECLQPLGEHSNEGECFLCKKPIGVSHRKKQMAKLKYELTAQLQESRRLLEDKERRLTDLNALVRGTSLRLSAAQRRFEDLTDRLRSRRDAAIDELLVKRGFLEGQIESLAKQSKLAERIRDAEQRIKKLRVEVMGLEERIKNARSRQDARRIEADGLVNNFAVGFLRKDLPREDIFKVAQTVKADFERNICSVDGRVNFSASSITYLKSSVHFSIFWAALELDFFRYPRLIVNDNIEDKGMEEERSQNFQRLIVEMSNRSQVRHQIVFTTSKIAPELENTELCVGRFYTPEEKTLRLPP